MTGDEAENAERKDEAERVEILTPREIEVLTLLSQDQTTPRSPRTSWSAAGPSRTTSST